MISNPLIDVAPDTTTFDFNTTGPNQKWCTDVTEVKIPTTGEKLFISPMIDLYDRFPVALEVSDKNDALLADQTLKNAHNAYPSQHPWYIQTEVSRIQDKYINLNWMNMVCHNLCHVYQSALIMECVKVFRDNLKICCLSYIQTSLPKKR